MCTPVRNDELSLKALSIIPLSTEALYKTRLYVTEVLYLFQGPYNQQN
jgi:hypothetical protein